MPNKLAKLITFILQLALIFKCALSLKHHLVLNNDHRVYFSVSSFGYLLGGHLEVIVQNLTVWPDPYDTSPTEEPQFGFALIKSDHSKNTFIMEPGESMHRACMLNNPRSFLNHNVLTLGIHPLKNEVLVRCHGDNDMPALTSMHSSRDLGGSQSSFIHHYTKRAVINQDNQMANKSSDKLNDSLMFSIPEMNVPDSSLGQFQECRNTKNLPLVINLDNMGRRSYTFNFTMFIGQDHDEGYYSLSFHNCRGHREVLTRGSRASITPTRFNLSMLIYELNYPQNYLSAGVIPLPQMYFVLSVMFFLVGCIWVNFITQQKGSALKIHYLMTVLVFLKASSLLFHGINYHYIALDGQPVVTWAYLYYATRSLKGALFFITLALIGSGWSFIKHILSNKDKNTILVIVALQVIAHVAEIVLDQSTEGEASNEFWAELCSMVDLFSCVAILYPISWSIRHLEEASRTDGKAAINLKKLEIFRRFYIISTIYIYVTRIITFLFLSTLSYRYSWLAELVFELTTLIYFIVTGYFFQPMPTNPYLLLSTENNDLEEDILFSLDPNDMVGGTQLDDIGHNQDQSSMLNEKQQKMTRRLVEDIV